MDSFDLSETYAVGGNDTLKGLTDWVGEHSGTATLLIAVLLVAVLYFLWMGWKKQAFIRERYVSGNGDGSVDVGRAAGGTGMFFWGPNQRNNQQSDQTNVAAGIQGFLAGGPPGITCGNTLDNADPRAWMLKHYKDADTGVQNFTPYLYDLRSVEGYESTVGSQYLGAANYGVV